jgi:hypothetical protein
MTDTATVIAEAQRLAGKDEEALLVELGLREQALADNPLLSGQADLDVSYDSTLMGPLDDIKRLGQRVLSRWSRELYGIVCGQSSSDAEARNKVLGAINLGEAAVIAGVAGALIGLAVPAPLAAALAPLIVKRFILPAGEEVCAYWGEAIGTNP